MRHTPGPWHTGENKAELIIYAPNGYAVADAKVYHDKLHGTQTETAKANAELIALAPEMLHLLLECEVLVRDYPMIKQRITTVINKAKGE